MNYQFQYRKQYRNSGAGNSFPAKVARQTAIVMFLLLIVVLFKTAGTGTTELVSGRIADMVRLDYTTQLNGILVKQYEGLAGYRNQFMNGLTSKDQFLFASYPVDGKITSEFGERMDPITGKSKNHGGMDLSAPVGSDVRTVYSGVIEKVEDSKTLGLTLTINHNNGYRTVYGHLSEVNVNVGEDVSKDCVVAKSGNTGVSTGPHLHFEVHKGSLPVDPADYMKQQQGI